MANKTIFQLPASGALVSTDEAEKQLTGGGASQKYTLAQLLTFIQNSVTAFTQGNVAFTGGATFVVGVAVIDALGNFAAKSFVSNGGTAIINSDGSASFANGATQIGNDGSASFGTANFTIGALGVVNTVKDVEVSDTTQGFITKSPNGTRYRLKVDNAGNLGTEVVP